MPLTAPIALLLLVAVALAGAALVRHSSKLALMAGGAFGMVLVFSAVVAFSISRM